MSTLLYPLFKKFQIAPHEKQTAIDLVKSEILKRQLCTSDSNDSPSSDIPISSYSSTTTKQQRQQQKPLSTAQNLLSQCFDIQVQDQDLVPSQPYDKELVEYMALNETLGPNDNVLIFWKNHEKFFPVLASIVLSIYSIPASNTTVERLFSQANNTLSPRRTSMQTDKVNKCLFLNKNLLPLKEFDQEQTKHIHEKRKVAQVSMSTFTSTPNNDDLNPELEEYFSSPTTKRARVHTDENEFPDYQFIDKDNDCIDSSCEHE